MQCTAKKDLAEYITHERHLTVDQAIRSTQVEDLIKVTSEKDVLMAITGMILMAADYFNVGGSMTESQAVQTASLFMENHPMETLEDLILCLKNAKAGKYGPVYNRIDGQVIFTWFRLYLDEKYERFEQIKRKEKDSYETKNTQDFESLLPMLQDIIDKKNDDKPEQPHRITYEVHLSVYKLFMQNLNKEELLQELAFYKKKAANELYEHFDQYISLIENRIKELS